MFPMRGKIPSGSLFHKSYRDRHGRAQKSKTWYLKYYVQGRPIELPSGTDDYDDALTMLRSKVAAAAQMGQLSEHPERVRMNQLFDLLLEFYRTQERRSTYDVERKIESRLRPYFGKMKAQAITGQVIARYVASRRAEKRKPQNASINRELSYVRRALKLGAKQDPPLVLRVPHFQFLPEENVREGVLKHEQYRLVRDALPGYARIALVIGYHTGARKGEITQIRKERIDLKAGRIEITRPTTKTKRPRYLPIYGDMAVEIDAAIAAADPACPFLVQHSGERVHDFEKAWSTACAVAGVPNALFHDLRRTALTNMIEAGLSEKEAMEISGHRTRAVFDRYHIISERRMREMATKLDAHLKGKASASSVQDAEQDRRPN
jgi:integrase